MKLTIIPSTGSVGKDELFYNGLDLSSCGVPSDVHALQWEGSAGWIEFVSSSVENQPITELPNWANSCLLVWDQANTHSDPMPPTADQNKETASQKLYRTDWTTIPDVSDPAKSNPHLSNVDTFLSYRNAIRQYAVNPVAGDISWPVEPTAVWSTT